MTWKGTRAITNLKKNTNFTSRQTSQPVGFQTTVLTNNFHNKNWQNEIQKSFTWNHDVCALPKSMDNAFSTQTKNNKMKPTAWQHQTFKKYELNSTDNENSLPVWFQMLTQGSSFITPNICWAVAPWSQISTTTFSPVSINFTTASLRPTFSFSSNAGLVLHADKYDRDCLQRDC